MTIQRGAEASGAEVLDARVPQDRVASIYDRIAPIYDIWGKLTESRARDRAIELAEVRDGQTILEVAVGTGLAFVELARRNPNGKTIGVDLSPGMLKVAAERLKTISGKYRLIEGSAFDLPVANASIDILVNNYMFDLITFGDMDRLLAEFRRVLKPDGRLVLVNMTIGERFGSRLYDRIYAMSPRLMGGCRGVRLAERVSNAGFSVALREYHQQMLFPSEVMLARPLRNEPLSDSGARSSGREA